MKTIVTGESDWTLPNTNVDAFPNMVDNPSQSVDSDGQKYILAGTPLTAASDPTQSKTTVVMTPTNDPSEVYGILRTDVNVVNGPAKAAVVTAGEGNIANMDKSIQSVYSASFVNSLKTALPRLQLINRNDGDDLEK